MMNPDDKALWVAALRSGDYTQTDGVLQDEKGCNCCLGVLARIKNIPQEDREFWVDFRFSDGVLYTGSIPQGFCGIESDEQEVLIHMNDADNKSFNEIAAYIEANL